MKNKAHASDFLCSTLTLSIFMILIPHLLNFIASCSDTRYKIYEMRENFCMLMCTLRMWVNFEFFKVAITYVMGVMDFCKNIENSDQFSWRSPKEEKNWKMNDLSKSFYNEIMQTKHITRLFNFLFMQTPLPTLKYQHISPTRGRAFFFWCVSAGKKVVENGSWIRNYFYTRLRRSAINSPAFWPSQMTR